MATELIKARSLLASVNSNLKQKKVIPAAQATISALEIIMRSSLMKGERDEFERLLEQATYYLNGDKELRKLYPIQIGYTPGQERALLATLRELMGELQSNAEDQLKEHLALMQKKKRDNMAKIQKYLDDDEVDKAKALADRLFREYPNDSEMKAEIADMFVKKDLYAEAYNYLVEALKEDPEALFLYNRIGIVLRKLKDFDTAEQYYKRALEVCATDEYLWFNIGRLYFEWQKFAQMRDAAEKAIEINPKFAEAAKMKKFAEKKLAEG